MVPDIDLRAAKRGDSAHPTLDWKGRRTPYRRTMAPSRGRWCPFVAAAVVAAGAAACDDGTAPTSGRPAALEVLAGDEQTGPVGEALPTPITVRISDAEGRPVFPAIVWFEPVLGSGNVSPAVAETNTEGVAVTSWIMGPVVGIHTVRASPLDMTSINTTLTAQAAPGPASNLFAVIGIGQAGLPGETLSSPLVARVADRFGNAVRGVVVTWRVVTGNGSLSAGTTLTDAGGITSVLWTLGTQVTGQPDTVVAEAPGLEGSPAVFVGQVLQPPPGP